MTEIFFRKTRYSDRSATRAMSKPRKEPAHSIEKRRYRSRMARGKEVYLLEAKTVREHLREEDSKINVEQV